MSELAKLNEVADDIEEEIEAAIERWEALPEDVLTYRAYADAWSIKEVIGHLIDSASNNHQRFVRLQLEEELLFPDYSKYNEQWIKIQTYQDRSWNDLLALWQHYNRHLAHLMRCVDPASLNHAWALNPETRITLFDMMVDYLRHLKEHIEQIERIKSEF